jgi:hypothetical protein
MHFLLKKELYQRRRVRVRACVMVRLEAGSGVRRLVVDGPVSITSGTEFSPLPADVMVVDSEGNILEPTWGFWVSLETFDPFHLLTDWDGS